jgi:hypothetical protein
VQQTGFTTGKQPVGRAEPHHFSTVTKHTQYHFPKLPEAIDFIGVLWEEEVCQKGSKKAKILVIESECITCLLL